MRACSIIAGAALVVLAGCSGSVETGKNRVEVSGTGEVSRPAERVDLSLGFEVTADGPSEASERLRAKVNPLIKDLDGALPEGSELQARSLSIKPQYDWKKGERSLTGYQASRSVKLVGLPVAAMGEWTARLSQRNPQRLRVTNFRLEEGDSAEHQALAKAYQQARRRAETLADSAGQALGQAVTIKHQDASQPGPRPMMEADVSASSEQADRFKVGDVNARAQVRVTFALQ
ncbi:SIMPL domain-containing protein [Halomonadaceae bacterium KBTZ08]